MTASRLARRRSIAGVVLAAVALHALIPAGFMPAPGRPFGLELCPEGLPAGMLPAAPAGMPADAMGPMHPMPQPQGHPHPGGALHVEHCAFGSAPGAAPVPHITIAAAAEPAARAPIPTPAPRATGDRPVHVPPARGPPIRA